MAKANVFNRILKSNERVDRRVEKLRSGDASKSYQLGVAACIYFVISVVAVIILPPYARYVVHLGLHENYAIFGNLFVIVGGVLLYFVPMFFASIALLYAKGQCSVNELLFGRLVKLMCQAMFVVVIPATILTAVYLYSGVVGL